ncbi:hypothetical protein YC2023_012317 [Brassica napus]
MPQSLMFIFFFYEAINEGNFIESREKAIGEWYWGRVTRQRVGAGGSHSLVSVQAQDWVSRDAVTRRYTGGSELGFCPGKLLGVLRMARGDSHLLVPGNGGSESSTVAAKGSEGRRLLQLCVVVKFPGGRGVICLASSAFVSLEVS